MGKISHVLPLEASPEAAGNKQIMFTLKVNLSRTINKLQGELKMIDKLRTQIIPFHREKSKCLIIFLQKSFHFTEKTKMIDNLPTEIIPFHGEKPK